MVNKLLMLMLIVIIGLVLGANYVGADYTSSFAGYGSSYSSASYQYQPSFQTYYGNDVNTYWPILNDKDVCKARQDMLLQVSPAGCQPMVVRSDLLADQNVPVFCQIDALQVNPLIDIKEIKNINFRGNYPKEVAGVGFHPARAALNTRDRLLGSPLINNIGYVVVILKQTKNESSLPKFVNLTLTGKLEYNAGNAYGIGTNEFYLEPTDDNQWENAKIANSFWNGRYFIRLYDVDETSALVSIYDGDREISKTRIKLGETSAPMYLPGSYCSFGLTTTYTGLAQSDKKARIEISDEKGTNNLDVYQGSEFLNGRCRVSEILVDSQTGSTGSVKIACDSDLIKLEMRPNLYVENLPYGRTSFNDIGANKQECKVDFNDEKSYRITRDVVKEASGDSYSSWTTLEIYSNDKKDWTSSFSLDDATKDKIRNALANACDFRDDKFLTSDGKTVNDVAEKAFNDAIDSYEEVAKDYTSERQAATEGVARYGELALRAALDLVQEATSKNYAKKETKSRLLNLFISLYPESAKLYQSQRDALYQLDSSISTKSVNVDNKFRTIRLVSLNNPESANEKAKAKFTYGGRILELVKGEAKPLKTNAMINVTSFDALHATIRTNCVTKDNGYEIKTESGKPVYQSSITLSLGESENVCGEPLVFKDTDLKKVAKIRISPTAYGPETETNISVKIGIEKRAIQLSPEKTKDMILNINKSIQKWESISKSLVKVETGLKAACFATSAVLTVKTFLYGIDGTATARQKVMTGDYGWNKRCNDAITKKWLDVNANGGEFEQGIDKNVNYGSIIQCINDNTASIEKDVQTTKNALVDTNKVVKVAQDSATTKGILNQDLATKAMIDKIGADCKQFIELLPAVVRDSKTTIYPVTLSQSRDIYANCLMLKQNPNDQNALLSMKSFSENAKNTMTDYEKFARSQASNDILPINTGTGTALKGKFYPIVGNTIGEIPVSGASIPAGATHAVRLDNPATIEYDNGIWGKVSIGAPFIVVGTELNGKLRPLDVFKYEPKFENGKVTSAVISQIPSESYQGSSGASLFMSKNGYTGFEEFGQGLYGNTIREQDRAVLYFISGPDKDLPSQVPFDVNNGWYVKVQASSFSLGSNAVKSYDASGLPKDWQICNVGSDGMIGSNDDCQAFNQASLGATILGLDAKTSQDLVQKSQKAILDAASQKNTNTKQVSIFGQPMRVDFQNPMENVQCSNFMTAGDCKLLFNVCDPVICPASRCNLGGAYRVANVQQTGIVGSALLCLPNAREGILLPVCVSGIRNGIDAYVSLLKQHRDCLQQNLDTGELVGVCDEIQSIYTCEFFWRQVAPIASMLLPKLVENVYSGGQGTGVNGGGEYLFVPQAWDNAKNSMDYFTNYYAENTFKAFQIRSVEEAGTEVCRGFVSLKAPTSIKTLLEPDSPPQFYARFDSTTFSTVTVPATAQYKVFYFINAGNDAGVYYSVYLKSPPESGYYYSNPTIQIANGYISKGQSSSQTLDKTAPEGYKELCVRINNEEECGFKQVSTDFSVNYLRDQYAKDQLTNTNIQTQAECVSGTSSLAAVGANLNLQSAAQEAAMPDISQRGIVRICATLNPGGSTDPTRYIPVGICGDANLKCWLDKTSVNNAITDANLGVKNATLQELEQTNIDALIAQGEILNNEVAVSSIKEINNRKDILRANLDSNKNIISDAQALELSINDLYGKLVLNNHKAWLLLIRAEVKAMEAEYYMKNIATKTLPLSRVSSTTTAGITQTHSISFAQDIDAATGMDVTRIFIDRNPDSYYYIYNDPERGNILYTNKISGPNTQEDNQVGTVDRSNIIQVYASYAGDTDLSVINGQRLTFDNSGIPQALTVKTTAPAASAAATTANELVFTFQDGTISWNLEYRFHNGKWQATNGGVLTTIPNPLPQSYRDAFTATTVASMEKLSKASSLQEGLKILIDRTLANNEGGWFANTDLLAGKFDLDSKGEFTSSSISGINSIYRYGSNGWEYYASGTNRVWIPVKDLVISKDKMNLVFDSDKTLVNQLSNQDFYGGALILFSS
ncbi:hypothetical protein J4217_02980 [Candidatus Pacearchaeota archaeon]|nr:hypothetical protein [Candidatus Pacearchaeota archaeon]